MSNLSVATRPLRPGARTRGPILTNGSSALALAPGGSEELATPPGPPPPALLLVRVLLEVLSGWRPASQLATKTSPQIAADLEARAPRRSRGRPPAVERLRVTQPAAGVAEVCAVVRRGPRCGAMALRLEHGPRGWLVTRLQVG